MTTNSQRAGWVVVLVVSWCLQAGRFTRPTCADEPDSVVRGVMNHCLAELDDSSVNPHPWLRLLSRLDLPDSAQIQAWKQLLLSDSGLVVRQALDVLRRREELEASAFEIGRIVCSARYSDRTRIAAADALCSIGALAPETQELLISLLEEGRSSSKLTAKVLNLLDAPSLRKILDHRPGLSAMFAECPELELACFLATLREDQFSMEQFNMIPAAVWLRESKPQPEKQYQAAVQSIVQDSQNPAWLRLAASRRIIDHNMTGSFRSVVSLLQSDRAFVAETAMRQLSELPVPSQQLVESVTDLLITSKPQVQLRAAQVLKRFGTYCADSRLRLCVALESCDGGTDDAFIATCLECLRASGLHTRPVSERVGRLLSESCPVYQGRDKQEVVRLRVHVMITLARIGFPSSCYRYILDSMVNVDDQMLPCELGAAVYAASTLGEDANGLAPYVLGALSRTFFDDDFSLQAYSPEYLPVDGTTLRLEVVRALAKIANPKQTDVVARLRELAEGPDQELAYEASMAVRSIERRVTH